MNAQIEVNKHFLSIERESERGQGKETAGSYDRNTFKASGIVELFSIPPFIRGHGDRDVGDIMSTCQRGSNKQANQITVSEYKTTTEVVVGSCHLQYISTL